MVTVEPDGACSFRVYVPHAGRVELLGSFSGWEAGADDMQREPGGWWTRRWRVPAGDHEFCYLIDGRSWMPDYAATGIRRNSDGNWISLLTVPPAPAPAAARDRDRDEIPGRAADVRTRRPDPVPIEAGRPLRAAC
jgi:hypothetical protein